MKSLYQRPQTLIITGRSRLKLSFRQLRIAELLERLGVGGHVGVGASAAVLHSWRNEMNQADLSGVTLVGPRSR